MLIQYVTIILMAICPLILRGSCSGPDYTITELLNHDENSHHIFTCRILKTYMRGLDFESIAVVATVFKGSPKDTVYIGTGGSTTAGGEKFLPNSEWLIFSTTKDSLHYGAMVCDYLSALLKHGNNDECRNRNDDLGKIYLDVLNQYGQIAQSNYTGYKMIYGNGKLVAKGGFKNGLPDGEWVHYRRDGHFENEIIKSKINYTNGIFDGKYQVYFGEHGEEKVTEKRVYRLGLPIEIETENGRKKRYEYINEKERRIITEHYDKSGNLKKQAHYHEFDYDDIRFNRIGYMDGHYLNKIGRDSSRFSPLGEGDYKKGARVGKWKFFNKKGEIVKTEIYPPVKNEGDLFLVYDDAGKVKVSGQYENKLRVGIWKYFYNGKLEFQESYNSIGEKIYGIHHYVSGGMEYTPYLNGKKHGQQIAFRKTGEIRSIETYRNGVKNGRSIFFKEDGTIEKELTYINSREFTVFPDLKKAYYFNGYLNGHFVQSGKLYEGDLWNGYRIGVWIDYHKDGSYTKMFYPTDKDVLLNRCGHNMPDRFEKYDKDGKLINAWKLE